MKIVWLENTQQQNVTVVQNNPIGETEIKIGPSQLYLDLREYTEKKKLDVRYGHWFPHNPEWLVRIIQAIKLDLKAANILVENGRTGNERWIMFKKILTEKIDDYIS